MLKKNITFTDFNDVEHSKDFYFNLSKSELAKAEIRESIMLDEKVTGGFRAKMEAIVKSGRGNDIMDAFEDIIRMTYGVKDEDGLRFVKNDKATEDFMQTNAYDVLFFELVTDAEAAAKFINEVVPRDVSNQMKETKDRDKPDRPYPTAPSAPSAPIAIDIPEKPVYDLNTTLEPVELTRAEIQAIMNKRQANPGV